MKRCGLYKALRAMTLLLLLPLIFLFWLIATESGLRFVYQTATNYLPGNLSIGKLEGSLIGPLIARNIQYKQDGMIITAKNLNLKWRPAALLTNMIEVRSFHLQSLNVTLPAAEKNKTHQAVSLPEINLPWRIALKDIVVDDFSLTQYAKDEKDEKVFYLKQVKLNATTLFNQVNIKSLTLKTDYAELNLKGELNLKKNYPHKLNLQWKANLPIETDLQGKGSIEGDLNAIKVIQQVTGLAQLTINAEVHDLLDNLNWQADIDINEFDPSKIWPEWPGQFKGKLISKGRTEKGQLIADVDISKLNGELRGYPVSLNSHMDWRNAGLDLGHFELRSGKTLLSANGRFDTKLNFNWTLSSDNLAELYPDAQGQLHANGQLVGTPSLPKFTALFNGQNLNLPSYKIEKAEGEIALDIFHWQQVKINLAAQTLKVKELELKSLNVTLDKNKLQLKIISDLATALLEVEGKMNTQGLHASINKADLISPRFADWKLKTPAAFSLDKNQFLLDPLCWQSAEGNACVTLQHKNANWQSKLEIQKLPLMFLGPWLPSDLKLEGLATANAELQFNSPDKIRGQAHIILPPGLISYPLLDDKRDRLKYRGGTLDITLNDQGLKATSEITISNDERFKAQLTLPDIKLLALDSQKQLVQASAEFTINNPGIIEALIPETQNVKGEVALNLAISGTLAHPRLKGNARLNNGSLSIPRLGLNIKQLTLKSESDGLEKLEFQLAARSGEGHIAVQGQTLLNSETGWPTTIKISGENFEVAHIPVSHITVSPDLQIKLQKHNININGKVHIPYAKLQPKDITSAARVSDDVVIIVAEQPVTEKWLIYTKVRLTLGERIHFYGFGFEGRFGGSLLLEDEPGQPTRATGEINVPEGRYAAYGQRLLVEHGRLLYTGSPVTNPGLDLRAVRKIGTVTAGLKVRGTLSNPQIELFSIPVMGQTDILAYILLGRPIEKATGKEGEMMAKAALALSLVGGDSLARTIGARFGLDEMRVESSSSGEQASLVMGRYLSPKLYIGYGVGLIESFNTVNVRYQISEHWQLKGESGESHGADFLYTIER